MNLKNFKWTGIKNPLDLHWQPGELPAPDLVPKECTAVVWVVDSYNKSLRGIRVVRPWGGERNAIRWSDGCTPATYENERVAFFAWLIPPGRDFYRCKRADDCISANLCGHAQRHLLHDDCIEPYYECDICEEVK